MELCRRQSHIPINVKLGEKSSSRHQMAFLWWLQISHWDLEAGLRYVQKAQDHMDPALAAAAEPGGRCTPVVPAAARPRVAPGVRAAASGRGDGEAVVIR